MAGPDRVAIRRDVLPGFGRGTRELAARRARRRRAANDRLARSRGQPVHDRRLGAATSVLPLPERQPDAPGQFAFANDQRVRGILRDSGWSGVELRRVDIACAMPERELVGYFTDSVRSACAQNADERTRAQVNGDTTIRGDGDSSANDTESRSSAGLPWSSSSGLCSKLCSDRDGSRRIGRHRTELRSRDIDRKSRVLACFVTA